MKKVYFFWDCDELLVMTVRAFRKFVFEKFNVVLPKDLHDFEKIEDQLGLHNDVVSKWWSLFNTSDYLSKNKFAPNKKILDFIIWLSLHGYESHIITSRPEDECRISTENWKDVYFGKSIKSVQFCNSYSKNASLRIRKKSEAIQELVSPNDFLFFADDTHTHAIEVAETFPNNSIVYLLEKSWNKNREIPYLKNLGRVKNEIQMINSMMMVLEYLHPHTKALS